jgi:hypothetical protein
LSRAQLCKLFWSCIQFELCRNYRFHTSYCIIASTTCQVFGTI